MIVEMFPDIEEVFVSNNPEINEYFFPICSVDISSINPNWDDVIHFVLFNEDPYYRERVQYFNHYCKDNTIGFKLVNDKFELLTDIGFMYVSKDWNQWLDKTKNSYIKSKMEYNKNQYSRNYHSFIKIGNKPIWVQQAEIPLSIDGRELNFIGQFYSSDFTGGFGGQDIYVFYDPIEKIVIHRYQIT